MGYRTLFLAAMTFAAVPVAAADLRIFAAASLTDALDEALSVCTVETTDTATGIYAGSGTIARQIEQGAPADIYVSANPQWMDWLQKRGMIVEGTRQNLLGNQLVIAVPREAEGPTLTLNDLGKLRLATGEVNSVPVGIYARQALEAKGLWGDLKGRLIQASSVREVLTWITRSEVSAGIIYKTDALNDDRVAIIHEFAPEAHDSIHYPAAIVSERDTPNARHLLACLMGEEASDVFGRFGFTALDQ